jgi:hypothetical protein
MPEFGGKPFRAATPKWKRSGSAGTSDAEAPKKKNLRLHQSKIDEAKAILGTATETETIETALDLVVFRKELIQGVRAMRDTNLVNLFDAAEE